MIIGDDPWASWVDALDEPTAFPHLYGHSVHAAAGPFAGPLVRVALALGSLWCVLHRQRGISDNLVPAASGVGSGLRRLDNRPPAQSVLPGIRLRTRAAASARASSPAWRPLGYRWAKWMSGGRHSSARC